MGEVEQVTKQSSLWEALSTITKMFLRPVIVEMTDRKYIPFRTGGRTPGCPLAATKFHKLGASKDKCLLCNFLCQTVNQVRA